MRLPFADDVLNIITQIRSMVPQYPRSDHTCDPSPSEQETQGMNEATALEVERPQHGVEELEKELEDSRKETAMLREREGKDQKLIQEYRGELEDMKAKMKTLRNELSEATQNVGIQMERMARNAKAEVAKYQQASDEANKRARAYHNRAREAESSVAGLERALKAAHGERQKTAALLETRTSELLDAQVYLTKVDEVTDSEVLNLINRLNSHVFQTASSIADRFETRYANQRDLDVVQLASGRLHESQTIAPSVIEALCLADHSTDAILLLTALQGIMISYAHRLCSTWDFVHHSSSQDTVTFEMVHGQIAEREPQSVSGRWRALTRTHLKAFRHSPEDCQRAAQECLAGFVVSVLLVCGVASDPPLLEEVQREFGEALREIVQLALEFQRTTGESIISRDLLPVLFPEGTTFDCESMENEWTDAKSARRTGAQPVEQCLVLCTTQLGLGRVEGRVGTASSADKGDGAMQSVLLLKPRVVLRSMLEELYDEQKA